jgi:hypothetical protein
VKKVIRATSRPAASDAHPVGSSGAELSSASAARGSEIDGISLARPDGGRPDIDSTCVLAGCGACFRGSCAEPVGLAMAAGARAKAKSKSKSKRPAIPIHRWQEIGWKISLLLTLYQFFFLIVRRCDPWCGQGGLSSRLFFPLTRFKEARAWRRFANYVRA